MIRVRHWINGISAQRYAEDRWEEHGVTLADVALPQSVACWYDGRRINPEDYWKVTPRDASDVTFVYTEADPGFISGTLFTAFSYASTDFVGGFFGLPNFGTPAAAFGEKARGKLLGLIAPEIPGLGTGTAGSAQYGSERPTSATSTGSIVPVCYGSVQTAGVILQSHSRAADGGGDLVYEMIIGLSHGPIAQIGLGANAITSDQDDVTGANLPEGLLLSELEASELQDVRASFRIGSLTGSVAPGFEKTIVDYAYKTRLNRGITQKHETRQPVQEVRALLQFPRGLRSVKMKDGEIAEFAVEVKMDVYTLGGSLVTSRTERIAAAANDSYHRTIIISGLALDKYEVRVSRVSAGDDANNPDPEENESRRVYDCDLVSISEVDYYAPAYRGIAAIYLTVRASEQLQGVPVLRVGIKGRPLMDPRVEPLGISGATNASPIVVTSTGHGLSNGDVVTINGVAGNTGANGIAWQVANVTEDTFELVGSVGNGAYSSGGDIYKHSFSVGGDEPGRNNALVVLDLLLNKRYGMGRRLAFSQVLLSSFEDAADFADELVPEVTGSATTEPRFRFDGVIDTRRRGWEIISEIAGNARMIPARFGDTVEIILLEAIAANADLSMMDSQVEGTAGPKISFTSVSSRPNQIRVTYFDSETWQQKAIVARVDAAEAPVDDGFTVEEKTLIGCTRATEAERAAYYLLRRARSIASGVELTTGHDANAIRPGDVITVDRRRTFSGRVSSSTSTTRVLDRAITLQAGKTYEYREVIDGAQIVARTFTGSATTTSTLNTTLIPDGFPAGDATGRVWMLQESGARKLQFRVTSISYLDDSRRRVRGEQYLGGIVENDDTGSDATGVISPTLPPAPADTASVSISNEAFVRVGVSSLDISWSAVTGASIYRLFVSNLTRNTAYSLVAEATGTSRTINVSALPGEQLQIAVVAVGRRGLQNAPENVAASATAKHTILRDDENGIIAEFPGDPSSLAIGSVSDTDAELTWTAGSNADGHIVYLNRWTDRAEIADVAAPTASQAIKLNNRVLGFGVRAYLEKTNIAGETVRYYSPGELRAVSSLAVPSGFSLSGTVSQNAFQVERIRNGSLVEYSIGTDNKIVVQNDPNTPLIYSLQPEDVGSTQEIFVSTDARVFPFFTRILDGTPSASPFTSFTGQINKRYVSLRLLLIYGTALDSAGEISSAATVDITNRLQEDLVFTGRYFSLRIECNLRNDIPENEGRVLCAIERLALALNA